VAYGVRLIQYSGAGSLASPAAPGVHTVNGRMAGEWATFLVTYQVHVKSGEVLDFEPVVPRRHLWDEELAGVLRTREWVATKPGWMLFFSGEEGEE
jgi:hypothetical protein